MGEILKDRWGCGKVLWGVVKYEGRCGEVWESVLGWGGVRKSVGKCWGRCGKVCLDVREVWEWGRVLEKV